MSHFNQAHEGSKEDLLKSMRLKCTYCKESFYKSNELMSHFNQAHEGNKPLKPFICQICDKRLKCQASLRSHVRMIHEGLINLSCGIS